MAIFLYPLPSVCLILFPWNILWLTMSKDMRPSSLLRQMYLSFKILSWLYKESWKQFSNLGSQLTKYWYFPFINGKISISLEKGNGNALQYSCLENPMDRVAWRATTHGVARVGYDLATKPPPSNISYKWVFPCTALLIRNTGLNGHISCVRMSCETRGTGCRSRADLMYESAWPCPMMVLPAPSVLIGCCFIKG